MEIAQDGTVTINGKALQGVPDLPVHTVVLDELHRVAARLRCPVDAHLVDHREQQRIRLRVHVDGSSEALGEPRPLQGDPDREASRFVDQDTAVLRLLPLPSQPQKERTEPTDERPPGGAHRSQERYADPQDGILEAGTQQVTGGGPARLLGLPQTTPHVPDDFKECVEAISETIARSDYPEAARLIADLRSSAMSKFGMEHPHSLEVLALEAYTDYLMGHHERSTKKSLRLALLRHQRDDARARDEVARAAVSWCMVSDVKVADNLGREILAFRRLLTSKAEFQASDERELVELRKKITARGPAFSAPQARS
ncbi:hypothetical protein ACIBQ5_33725 [Streptomyces massasporeus]|uniref:hypothetical protein n=1 Tax=Streptomyces massasporeus TaxID=67324 RepID=UPI00379BE482